MKTAMLSLPSSIRARRGSRLGIGLIVVVTSVGLHATVGLALSFVRAPVGNSELETLVEFAVPEARRTEPETKIAEAPPTAVAPVTPEIEREPPRRELPRETPPPASTEMEEAPDSVNEPEGGSPVAPSGPSEFPVPPEEGNGRGFGDGNGEGPPPPTVDERAELQAWVREVHRSVVARAVRSYPQAAIRTRLAGTVIVTFGVEADGSIPNVSVHASSGHAVLDEAALEAVRSLVRLPIPPPAYMRSGRPLTMPIRYELPG